MKIKLAILEQNQTYLERLVNNFNTKYTDKFEIYSFTDLNVAMEHLKNAKIDVFLANDIFNINVVELPPRCGFAYLVDTPDIDMENGQRAVCKFQKAELIYKQILSIYSEKTGFITGTKFDDDNAKMIIFASACGGTGTSTIAASAAMHFAMQGIRTLYLNLETFGSSDCFFKGEGQFDMSDVVFALKSKKTNLGLKLESCVKQDKSGVFFFSQPKLALDILELNSEEIIRLISVIRQSGEYDYIIIDMDFSIDKNILSIYRQSHAMVWVSDGRTISNTKVCRAYAALSALEQNMESPLVGRIKLIYNKMSGKTKNVIDNINTIGSVPKFDHAEPQQILQQLAYNDVFDKII